MLIFLDFDGVLRRRDSPPYRLEKPLLDAFEAAVRRIHDGEIVITSSWREVVGLSGIRNLFSSDIAPRVVGVAPIVRFREDFPRYREVLAYLKQRKVAWQPWIAVDDDELAYPSGAPVVVVNPNFGFGAAEGERLVEMAEGV
jgi:HAD domain in Swiss Army Knife RNA repair proteins